MTTTITGVDHARTLVGEELGLSAWLDITQEGIDRFADATHDHQWVHVDVARAQASDLGGTIAHGLYTLSLGPQFTYALVEFRGFKMSINYGYERIRFPSPVPAGSRIRMRATLLAVTEVSGGIQVTVRQQFEAEGVEKPVCVADSVARWLT